MRWGRVVVFSFSTMLAAPTAMFEITSMGDTNTIAWDPTVLVFSQECASTFWQSRRSALCIIEPLVDSSGNLHVFLAQRPLGQSAHALVERRIEHLLISNGEVHQLPPIQVELAPAIAIRAVATQTGDLQLLWVEDEFYVPNYHDRAIYLQRYRDGAWGNRQVVLDERARPSILRQDDLALLANQDGSIDVFWNDVREYHFLVDLLTMGHGGNYLKTYRRRLTGNEWSETQRIQRRGTFEPLAFGVLPKGDGPSEVFWSETSGSTATISRSAYSRGRWTVEETIGRCKSYLGQPHVFDLNVTSGISGNAKVAWTCSRYESTEPGTRKNDLFNNLYVSIFVDGAWTTGPILARNTSSFRWLWNGSARSVLLVQEYAPRPRFWKPTPVPLFVNVIDGNRAIATEVLSERSIEGAVEATANLDGTIHVIFAEPISDTEAILKYRRGKYQGR